jgi:gliding motility-associated-like protein
MIYNSTQQMFKKTLSFLVLLLAITLFGTNSYAQTKNYATVMPSSGTVGYHFPLLAGAYSVAGETDAGSITNPGNAAVVTPGNPAVLSANYINVLGLARYEGEVFLQLKHSVELVGGKTTYIKFDQPTLSGINVDLLNIVGGLTGLLSNNVIQLEAYTGATATTPGTRINPVNVTSTIVRDAAGVNYFAVTSAVPYNSVRVRMRLEGNLLGLASGSINMNVYTAFSYNAGNCGPAAFAGIGERTGINVSLTSTVINPERAIDGDLSTFSNLQAGLVGALGSVSQTFYLPSPITSTTDVAKIYLSQPGTVLSVDLLKTIRIQAYNGNTPVSSAQTANQLLGLQLLTGTNNAPLPLYYSPGGNFDRIQISIDNTLAVGGNLLSGGLYIHEVQRTVAKPTLAGVLNHATTICGGSSLTLAVSAINGAFTYNYYKKTGNGPVVSVAAANAGTYTEAGLAEGTYTYYIGAQKAGCIGESERDSVVVTVNPVLILTAATLINASSGKVYSRQINPATGGVGPYTYALATGSTLPAGLTVSAAGLIAGTPTAAGSYTFSITATDSFGCTVTTPYTLIVAAPLTLGTGLLPNGTVGVGYVPVLLPSPVGGTTPYTFSALNLPPGLTLNATGELGGTPTQAGTFTFPATVTDADGNTATTNFTLVVRNPLVLSPATLTDGITGITYPTQVIPAATGGSGIYTYTATGLPPGLGFTPGSREMTGTPTQPGTYTVIVNVTDNEGKSASANYSVTIKDPLVLPAMALANGTVGVAYPTETLPVATGGTGPYTYTAVNLPPGLTFNATTREITGTPTQSGTFTLMATVTDNAGTTVTVPYTITVNGTLNLPVTTLASATVGTSYTSQILPVVTGGTSPYTYSMANLPAGLSFDPATRIISGNPGIGGNFTLTMRANDSGGLSTSTDYLLNVNVAAPTVAGITICSGNIATLNVSNNVAGVTYNFYSGTGTTPLGTGTTYTTGVLNESATFYVEAVSGTAISARVPVTVTVNPSPELPVIISSNQTISTGQTTILEATAPAGAIVKWFAASTGGTALATGNTYTTPILTATTVYYAGTENTSTGCASLSRVPVTVTVASSSTNPNCNAAATQQSGISGLLCVGCSIQGAGNSVDADLTNYTQINLAVGAGATGSQRLIFQRSGAATDSIRVDLETPTGLLDLSALGGITLNVRNGNIVVRSYPVNPSLVSLSLLGGNRFTVTIPAGGLYDRIEVRFSPVVAALNNLRIYGAEVILPNPTVTAGSQTICSGSPATLTVSPADGTTITWYNAPTAGTALLTGNSYTTPALTATTTYYVQVSRDGCANLTRVPVVVTVTPALNTPVLAAISPVCSGSSAVLAIDNPQTGTVYNWYTTDTGTAPVFTGPVYTIPGVTANATYYVSASNGNCTSAARAVANVVVNPRPVLPQIQASATAVTPGQSVRLTASSSESAVVFNWYNAADATTPVFTGATYVTPPINATTTFYVEATSTLTGCASLVRVQQTIVVNPNGNPVPVECELPVSQSTGSSTGVLLVDGRVDNPTLAIDGDQQTGSTLSILAGLNGSVFQRVAFNGLSNVGDTVQVRLTTGDQLLSAGILAGVQITSYQGTASNGDSQLLNSGLINLQILNGGTEAIVNFVPTARFDGIEVRLNSGILGALTTVNFNSARRITLAPVVSVPASAICAGTTATLTVTNPQPGIIYKWFDAAGVSQNVPGTGEVFVTPALNVNTQYIVSASRGDCIGSKTVVRVTVTPAPAKPVLASTAIEVCLNSNVTLAVQNPEPGITYQWYNGTTLIAGANAATYTISGIVINGQYHVEAQSTGCTTVVASDAVSITVGTLSAPQVNPQVITINSGQRTLLVATSPVAGVIYSWYTTNPASPVSTSTNGEDGRFFTPVLTATTTYHVVAQNTGLTGCVSAAADVVVNVIAGPVTPVPVPCEAPTTTTTTRTGGLLSAFATVDHPGFAVDADTASGSTLLIPLGTGSFVAQKVTFTGLSPVGDKVRIGISSGTGLSLALASSITVTSYNGTASNNDETLPSNQPATLQLFNGGLNGIIEFTPSQPFDGVELKLNSGLLSAPTSINFNYAQRIMLPPTVEADAVTVCEGTAATLRVLNPLAGTTYTWYLNGTPVGTGVTQQTATSAAGGTYNYSVSASRNSCQSILVPVTVTVVPAAPAPIPSTTNPGTTCFNTPVTLRVDQAVGVTYNWYNAATGGSLLAANTSEYTTPAGLGAGTTTFYVESVNANACGSAAVRVPITIMVKPNATIADINISASAGSFCSGSSAQLTASSTTLTNPVFTWYTDAALTNAVFTGAVYNIARASADATYYVTVRSDEKCDNTTGNAEVITLMVNPPATAADISISGITSPLCIGSTVELTATASAAIINPVFTWYSDAALTNVVSNLPTYTTAALSGTTNFYVTVQGTNRCPNPAANAKVVTVTLNPTGTPSDITVSGIPSSTCSGTGASLTASSNTVVNPIFTWYNDAALTSVAATGQVFNPNALTETTTYFVTVRGLNRCENLAADATIVTVSVNAPIVFTGSNLSPAPVNSAYSVQINPATGGTPAYTYTVLSGSTLPEGLSLSAGGVLSGTAVTAGTYSFAILAIDSKGCTAAAQFSIVVSYPPLILPPATLPTGEVGTSYPTQILPSATGGKGPYSYVATGLPPGLTFNPLTREITGIPTSGGTFPVTVTVTDGNGNTATATYTITVTVPAPVVPGTTACAGSPVTLAVSNPISGIIYNWYNSATGGTSLNSGSTFQTPAISSATTYYVEGSSGSAVSGRTAVTITLKPLATTADISVSGVPAVLCAGSGATLTASSATVTNPQFTWYSDATLTNVISTDAVINIPALSVNTAYYVTVQGLNRCENTAATAKEVAITVNPALIFNGSTLTPANAMRSYSVQLTPANGGTPGYTYTLASGSTMPSGLTLSASGVISGTPTTAGSYNFSITAIDSRGCTATANFMLSVGTAADPLNLPPAVMPDGQVGSPYPTQVLPAATGGTLPYTYVATGLPPGLTFNPVTREITGTPTLGGTFPVTVTVTDAAGATATAIYTIVVTVPVPAVAGSEICAGSSVVLSVNNPVTNVMYNWFASASGGSIIHTGTTFQTPVINSAVTYYVEGASGTMVSSRTAVNITIPATLATPVVTVESSTFRSITFSWNAISGATAYEVSRDGGITWTAPSSGAAATTHVVSGLQPNATITLQVRAKGTTVCQTSAPGRLTGAANNGGSAGETEIFIPNTFTPNGDGNNDVFYVYGNAIVKVKMRIYNQWGQFLYESQQLQNGWDGSYKGQMQPNGVYVYYIDLTLNDGTTTMRKGTITLLR